MRNLVRGPREIVEWINKNDAQNFKYFSKYRGNFCPVIGSTGVTFVRNQLRLGFLLVTSPLRLDTSVVSYNLCWLYTIVKVKQFLYGSWGFQEVEAPDLQAALLIGRHQYQELFLGLITVRGWVVPWCFVSRVSAMETKLVNITLTTRPTLPFFAFYGNCGRY